MLKNNNLWPEKEENDEICRCFLFFHLGNSLTDFGEFPLVISRKMITFAS